APRSGAFKHGARGGRKAMPAFARLCVAPRFTPLSDRAHSSGASPQEDDMIAVRRLGHATLTTPDIDRQIAYYLDVVGLTLVAREAQLAVLATKQGLEAIALEPGPPNALSRIAFQVAPGSDLGELEHALAKHGVKTERRLDITPGVAEAIVFKDPKGTLVE